ncbi:hypothetical protein LOC59_16445 [Arthrobacter sp. zg-Y916]|uniref:hypothetical protein n=1 Tax=Arthrobacter sp. zg-Y916 TaxID=2894190 RepID=UPI001E46D8F4|nr:hypothetical protein [Arthrobacter sp. zg-Y916]MCC9195223.1 hypothetical protein [Arthrobacter sp. zg-Y916]
MATPSAINSALNKIPKRAESRGEAELRSTFEDAGVGQALDTVDHQIIYGRRGTGKTHALRYLNSVRGDEENIAIYVDLRTIGSAEGVFDGQSVSPVERTARLLVDLLNQVHDEILRAALDDDRLSGDSNFVNALDSLLDSISGIRVRGTVELTTQESERSQRGTSSNYAFNASASVQKLSVSAVGTDETEQQAGTTETRRGEERISLNFSDVARALRKLAESISARRIWLLLDEWTSVPLETQPYLGAFLVRCVLPLQPFTVKIAAIEQQSAFRTQLANGSVIGIEVGADMSANLNLDDFMVFEQEEEKARSFFRSLFFKHLTAGGGGDLGLNRETDLIREAFTDSRAFDELVRAAEGVPRDAINIAANAAWRAGEKKISIPDVRRAARQWFQNDKERALAEVPEAQGLLNWVIDNVIRGKKARGFLVNQKDRASRPLIILFDARVLHLVRRGYSAQDAPGERFDVYVIDYGAYVDLISTQNAPRGVLPFEEEDGSDGFVDVPTQDLRALRRAVLDLDEFFNSTDI